VYRWDVVQNNNFPEEPENGWILPTNWYEKINDILRTTIVVKYLDGVEYLAKKLEGFCKDELRLIGHCRFVSRLDGYYAAHLYFGMEFEIPKFEWDTEKVYTSVEIQITTQVKELIKELLHVYYERNRLAVPSDEELWAWRFEDKEFSTNYLGHIIHYVEGMIAGIRKKENDEHRI
jgi:hypothetical protein